ncbi:histidinol-phosphatase [Desulfoscipio geothermicus]|uniref:Histidinol-phosphatase n=1 Tax=Desulfoscipio geothermicus DSM 3669 TaxID=1121426 RepID=A0A1I6DMG3_9FIRM|nr:histidinol-phosphatase [Desulfoscipio geothermicus]SFR06586.1 histidinol-phosphatase (PHP family) [Desulfoscipio geothermicus DSM 3669]
MSDTIKLVDYHVHPGYSIDAAPVGIDEYCVRAMQIGLAEICFTPHLEVDEARKHLDWFVRCNGRVMPMEDLQWLDFYFQEINMAREKFSPRLVIKAGIEVGYEPGREMYIEKILTGFPFDFVLGSIHCLNHVAISSKKECAVHFAGKTCAEVAQDYFTSLEAAVKSRLFDCMAHIDLYRRYGTVYLDRNNIEEMHRGYIEKIFKYMARHHIGLEINTSGLRRELGDLHPSKAIVQTALQQGVQIFTTGSDAHSLSEIGQGLQAAERLLKQFDLQAATFTGRKPDPQKGWTNLPTLP